MACRYKAACTPRRFPERTRAECASRVPRGKTASLVRSTMLPRGADRSHAAEGAGGRWAGANGILARSGEVAEPGLRRTPGERVNSEGFRGFKSPPLRRRVRTFCLHFGRGGNFARNVAFFQSAAHRREPADARFARFGEHSLRRNKNGSLSGLECAPDDIRSNIAIPGRPIDLGSKVRTGIAV